MVILESSSTPTIRSANINNKNENVFMPTRQYNLIRKKAHDKLFGLDIHNENCLFITLVSDTPTPLDIVNNHFKKFVRKLKVFGNFEYLRVIENGTRFGKSCYHIHALVFFNESPDKRN